MKKSKIVDIDYDAKRTVINDIRIDIILLEKELKKLNSNDTSDINIRQMVHIRQVEIHKLTAILKLKISDIE